jgi:hypothetical protein
MKPWLKTLHLPCYTAEAVAHVVVWWHACSPQQLSVDGTWQQQLCSFLGVCGAVRLCLSSAEPMVLLLPVMNGLMPPSFCNFTVHTCFTCVVAGLRPLGTEYAEVVNTQG